MRRAFLIAVPYAWLLALFLIPFGIVFKISLSDIALAIPPYTPTMKDGFGPLISGLKNKKKLETPLSSFEAAISS